MPQVRSERSHVNADRMEVRVSGQDSTILPKETRWYSSAEEDESFVTSVAEHAAVVQVMRSEKLPGYWLGHDFDCDGCYPALYCIISCPSDILDALFPLVWIAIEDAMKKARPDDDPVAKLSLGERMREAAEDYRNRRLSHAEEDGRFVTSVGENAAGVQVMRSEKLSGYWLGYHFERDDCYPALHCIVSGPSDILNALSPLLLAAIKDAIKKAPFNDNPTMLSLQNRMDEAAENYRSRRLSHT